MRAMVRKRYTAEFKAQAVELVKVGKTVPEVARELRAEGVGPIIYMFDLGERILGNTPMVRVCAANHQIESLL